MKKFLKFSMMLALAIVTFSCSNDNTDVIPDDPQNNNEVNAAIKSNFNSYARNAIATDQAGAIFENNEDNNEVVDQCFELVFPYTVTDGQTQTVINNQAEADAYFMNNPMGTVVFPVTINFTDGTQAVINNEFELIAAIEECFGGEIISIGNDCFEFVYPLDVLTASGNTVTVNSDLELFSVEDGVGFSYPISVSVTTATGTTIVSINSDEEFDALYNDCYDIEPCDDCGTNCFEVVYPITLVQEDGTVTTVNNDEEFIAFLDGLGADDYFVPTYPINIEYEDGTQATINNDAELEAAFDACLN